MICPQLLRRHLSALCARVLRHSMHFERGRNSPSGSSKRICTNCKRSCSRWKTNKLGRAHHLSIAMISRQPSRDSPRLDLPRRVAPWSLLLSLTTMMKLI